MSLPATVLVVDDSAPNRLLIEASLGAEGHRVVQAAGGAEGLDAIRAEKPDVVILDLMMPGVDGAEMLRRLRAESLRDVPSVLLMTALSEAESAVKALELGVDAHLAKPFAPSALRRLVRELLAARTPPAERGPAPA